MNSYRKLLLFLLFYFQLTAVFPQQPGMAVFTVKGIIIDDESGKPLEFATVSIKKTRDSSLVGGAITGPSGAFQINDLGPGAYSIEIAFIGYEKYVNKFFFKPQSSSPVNDIGTIRLKISALILKEAEITADKSFMMNNIDRKTYNTDQLGVTTGGNVTDVLQNIPSVEVDADGNVSLRGNENVTIFIDGRPSGLTGAGGKSLLESIPASAIEKVEVITNPSAKYDPDGISGIINIVTKKNKLQGFTGSVGATTSFRGRYNANISLNYRHAKWNVYTNYGFNKDVRLNTGNSFTQSNFNDVVDIRRQNDSETSRRLNHNFKFGADYNISDKSTISASALFNIRDGKNVQTVIYKFYNDVADSIYKRNTNGIENETNADINLSFKHYFPQKGRILNVESTASLGSSDENNEYDQLGYINDQVPYPVLPLLQKDFTKDNNKIYTASADYEHPLAKDKKIEAGIKSTFRNFDTDFRAESFDSILSTYFNNSSLTNHFNYKDQLHAFYAQYRQSIRKFGFQAGVRSEYALTESKLLNTGEVFNKDYFSIFPSAFLTYKPGEKSQFKATYSRRINRPRKQALNPFAEYDDPLNLRKGNPFLDPEYTDSYELEYTRYIGKLSLTATGYARFTHDYIQRFRQVLPDGVTVTTFENLTSARNYGLETILNGSPFKWWNFTLSTNMFRNELNATNLESDLTSASFSISGRIFTTFKLPYKTELQLSYFYRAPMKVTQGTMKDMQNFTIAVSKKILKDKGVISARLSDPFDVQRFGFKYRENYYYQDFTRKRQSRILTIGFTYRFGELKDRDTRKKEQPVREENNDYGE